MIVSTTDLSKIFVCFTDSISQTSSCRVQSIVFTKKAMKYFPLSNFGKMIEIVFLFTLVDKMIMTTSFPINRDDAVMVRKLSISRFFDENQLANTQEEKNILFCLLACRKH